MVGNLSPRIIKLWLLSPGLAQFQRCWSSAPEKILSDPDFVGGGRPSHCEGIPGNSRSYGIGYPRPCGKVPGDSRSNGRGRPSACGEVPGDSRSNGRGRSSTKLARSNFEEESFGLIASGDDRFSLALGRSGGGGGV